VHPVTAGIQQLSLSADHLSSIARPPHRPYYAETGTLAADLAPALVTL
jgi:hypothetical protein